MHGNDLAILQLIYTPSGVPSASYPTNASNHIAKFLQRAVMFLMQNPQTWSSTQILSSLNQSSRTFATLIVSASSRLVPKAIAIGRVMAPRQYSF